MEPERAGLFLVERASWMGKFSVKLVVYWSAPVWLHIGNSPRRCELRKPVGCGCVDTDIQWQRKKCWSGLVLIGLSLIACSTAPAALLIKVDKSAQTLTVTRDGQTLHTWPVSTGRTGYATPSGNSQRSEWRPSISPRNGMTPQCLTRCFSPSRVTRSMGHLILSDLVRLRATVACGCHRRMQRSYFPW